MGILTGVARTETGDVATGASIAVYGAGTMTPASLFQDAALTIVAANPVAVNANGAFSVYAADGLYDVVVSRPGQPDTTISSVSVIDPTNYAPASTTTGGDWTPTLTGITNVASSIALSCQWIRIGNQVFVSGAVAVTPTAGAASTIINMSLPVAVASFANSSKLGGCGIYITGTSQTGAQIVGDTVNLKAQFTFVSLSTAQHIFRFTFGYKVT